jgi:hypothetical protein
LGGLPFGESTSPRVLVDEADLPVAEKIARRFDKRAPLDDAIPEEIGPPCGCDRDTDSTVESVEEEPPAEGRGVWTLLIVALLAAAAMKILLPVVHALSR